MVFLDSDMVFSGGMIHVLIQNVLLIKIRLYQVLMLWKVVVIWCIENWDEEFYVKNGHFQFMDVKDTEERAQAESKSILFDVVMLVWDVWPFLMVF